MSMRAGTGGVKRRRGAGIGGGVYDNRKIAAIAAKINERFPLREYGRVMVKRGTPENIATYGLTFKDANAFQRGNRERAGYFGRGGYWGRLIGRKFGNERLGDMLGDIAGSAIRSTGPTGVAAMNAANLLGRVHSRYMGRGMYNGVVANNIVNGASSTFEVPSFGPTTDGSSVVISHKEYVQNIYAPSGSTTPFTNFSFQINPGLEEVFPWLSQVAVNYEEYELKQCIFTFRSTVSDFNSGTGQCGQIIMATQYNASSPPFADKQTMMSYVGANSSKTTEHQVHGIECLPSLNSGSPGKYVRWQPISLDQDLKEYDHAQFNLAITDIPSSFQGQSVGELWVSYTVELRKPKLVVNRALNLDRDFACILTNNTGSVPLPPRPWTEPFLGVVPANIKFARNNNIGVVFSTGVTYTSYSIQSQRLTFPPAYTGTLQIAVEWVLADVNPNLGCNGVSQGLIGNVSVIQDNPTVTTSGALGTPTWSHAEGCNIAACVGVGTGFIKKYSAILHVNVTPATSGVSNSIDIYPVYTGVVATAPTLLYANIDIMEYNASFRQKLNGSNDTMQLMDISGNPVNFP